MSTLLPAVLPVGLIIFIGFIVGRTLSLQPQTLSQLVLFVLSPALVIDSLYRTTLSVRNSIGLLTGFALTSLIIFCIVQLISKIAHLSLSTSRALTATAMLPNNGNMGLPVVAFALGEAGLERAIIYMVGSSILLFGFGPAIVQGKGIVQGLKLTLKLPLIWSISVGLTLRFSPIELPFSIDTAIQNLGKAAIPIALILLGIQLSTTKFQLRKKELSSLFIRLFIAPAIAYTVGSILNLELLTLQVLVLQSAMPTAVNSLVLVGEFGGDKDLVARAIVTSTLMSFISLPLVLFLLLG